MRYFLLIISLFAFLPISAQDTIFVSTSASGLNNGTSWSDAFTDLQEAIDSSTWGDEIWVSSGLYFPRTDVDGLIPSDPRKITFHLKEGIRAYGGFLGHESSRIADPLKNPTVLSGDIGIYGDKSDNCYHVMTNKALKQGYTYIEGFYIEQGNASSFLDRRGGGILDAGSAMVYNKIEIRDNEAESGGGIYTNNSESTFINCYIHHNKGFSHGGGFHDNNSQTRIKDCQFEANQSAGAGGGYFGLDSQVDLSYSIFKNNQADAGGGFFLGSSNLNHSWPPSKMHHIKCIGNSAQRDGGGGIQARPIYLTDMIFTNNTANGTGGGLSIAGHAYISNSLFHNNNGEGVAVASNTFGNEINFYSSTITHNGAIGGFQVRTSQNDQVQFFNSIINGGISKHATTSINYAHCLIPDSKPAGIWDSSIGTDQGGNIDSIPIFFSEANADYRLWKCSPGVDAGDSTLLNSDWLDIDGDNDTTELISTDLNDFDRINKSEIDIGAYEYHNVKFAYSDSIGSYSHLDTASSYTWINCSTGMVVSTGDTLLHQGDTSVTYALVVNKSGCIDTSECFQINRNLTISKGTPTKPMVAVYPNPATDMLHLHVSSDTYESGAIFSSSGVMVKSFNIDPLSINKINLQHLPPGIYILQLTGSGNALYTTRVVKH